MQDENPRPKWIDHECLVCGSFEQLPDVRPNDYTCGLCWGVMSAYGEEDEEAIRLRREARTVRCQEMSVGCPDCGADIRVRWEPYNKVKGCL